MAEMMIPNPFAALADDLYLDVHVAAAVLAVAARNLELALHEAPAPDGRHIAHEVNLSFAKHAVICADALVDGVERAWPKVSV